MTTNYRIQQIPSENIHEVLEHFLLKPLPLHDLHNKFSDLSLRIFIFRNNYVDRFEDLQKLAFLQQKIF